MDSDIKQEFEKLYTFLRENMITKEEFSGFKNEVNQRFDSLENSVNNLTQAVDKLAKLVKDMTEEHLAMKHQLMAMQEWIRKAAEKIGVDFKL